ncbi:hypothetical protein EW145_g1297 [Phellinidium pouzarii]|uniref:Probable RNA polymerase II nuclear localization protein SLC7A6OS n=1 Tax=Phellinidium pouzarii TaxID=167371 RepID=A0A4S4LF92_9AGAM|nr:hypothetical protein EW145_g1297 [Phellinidium pouzarii]
MDVNMNVAQSQGYTILRIKRKRDEDVPELLVVEPSLKRVTKKRRSGINIFQFAETVDTTAWDAVKQTELKNRIAELSNTSPESPRKNQNDMVPAIPSTISRNSSSQTHTRQYRVITQEQPELERRPSRFAAAPPEVLSSKDNVQSSDLRIYDAVLEPNKLDDEVDPEMEKFQSLLKDYLSVDESTPTQPEYSIVPVAANGAPEILSPTSNEYVYDIFYHRPSTLSDWAAASSMATVTGLPSIFINDDLDSDSEVEDEADEDSNAEDFYRNDYPDEESSEEFSDDDFSVDESNEGHFRPTI